ncbi:HXXEE domain-containing protein [Reinekea marinisedimentorum]|uniref:Uncharacterized protein with HXXEE motif n=1 Tax=Reinekea marinisedimentorum TaxID=230495 RepID=A0A4R3HU71_9GAMM|nr:HXXEE domain-containing protein [Reinekea marinisedimentorum]TCS36767.1 uncharacterized protein with HXXEE motif [Reinekea marinisedimentorum]
MLSFLYLDAFYALTALVLFLHEMEEWNIAKFHSENYENSLDESNLSARLWLFILSLTGLFFCILATVISSPAISASIFLILSTFLTINGLQHILLTVITQKYNPGLFFGGIVGTSLAMAFAIKVISEEVVPLWIFITITLLEFIPAIYDTVKSRKNNRLPNMVIQILRIGNFAEQKMVS